ncbi:hypothetical protein HanRHA438_Chr03g0145691 [Helianthus annuus]|nr:hypothetical protein HanHA89_Chr03g0123761 [Helianthus annuus]KAJ0937771.1 hypothetical protein HanRHA438_Chr03g0145691 [Helianthus annuus]
MMLRLILLISHLPQAARCRRCSLDYGLPPCRLQDYDPPPRRYQSPLHLRDHPK